MIKKTLLLAVALGFAGQAFAAAPTACDGATAGKITISKASTPLFIKTDFPQVCSNNVILNYGENNVVAWVASGSKKGKNSFIGHSDGGAPKVDAACDSTGCTAANVTASLAVVAAVAASL